MKKLSAIVVSFLILTTGSLLLTVNSFAQYGQYGSPPPTGNILIEKKVSMPFNPVTTKGGQTVSPDFSTLTFVNNLAPSDPRFKPGQEVVFQIRVQNTSSVTLNNVMIKDILPANVSPVAGPGSFDNSSNTVTFVIGTLNPGDQQVFLLDARIADQSQLPSDKSLFCLVNTAQVFSNASNGTNNPSDQSTSQFCIEKQVAGVTSAPSAGPEFAFLLVAGELATLGLGLYIRRK